LSKAQTALPRPLVGYQKPSLTNLSARAAPSLSVASLADSWAASASHRDQAQVLLNGALVTGLCARAKRRRMQRRAAQKASGESGGRSVTITVESSADSTIPRGTVSSMDSFMRENAASVCLANMDKITPVPGNPDAKYCYLAPNDIGDYRAQTRLTVRVDVAETGRCDVVILDMEFGSVDKKTGVATFTNRAEFTAENVITWKETASGDLELINSTRGTSTTPLPWWFPIPDIVVKQLFNVIIKQVVSGGLKKVNQQIREKYQGEYSPEDF